MNKTKLQTLLKPDDVLRTDGVRAPQRFVKVFTIPATKFRGTVIDVIEWTTAFEYTFKLAKLAYITTRVERHFNVRAQTEPNLVGLMVQVAGDDVMAAVT